MKLYPDWSPLEAGEIDNFAFNFTPDVGDASIIYTIWTCTLVPNQLGTDPDPQSRVVELSNPTSVDVRLANNTVQTLYGSFAVAQVGPCPTSAVGATYILDAQAFLTDTRVLAYNNQFRLVAPGQC